MATYTLSSLHSEFQLHPTEPAGHRIEEPPVLKRIRVIPGAVLGYGGSPERPTKYAECVSKTRSGVKWRLYLDTGAIGVVDNIRGVGWRETKRYLQPAGSSSVQVWKPDSRTGRWVQKGYVRSNDSMYVLAKTEAVTCLNSVQLAAWRRDHEPTPRLGPKGLARLIPSTQVSSTAWAPAPDPLPSDIVDAVAGLPGTVPTDAPAGTDTSTVMPEATDTAFTTDADVAAEPWYKNRLVLGAAAAIAAYWLWKRRNA